MFTGKYRICDAFGIPIYVETSFLFLLLLFVINMGSLSFGFAAALVLALSVTMHELGHALTARAFGYRTRDITLSLLGGCASLIALPRKAWQEFTTALAGPLVSFALAGSVFLLDVFEVRVSNQWLRGDIPLARQGDARRDVGGPGVRRPPRHPRHPLNRHGRQLGLHLDTHRVDDLEGRMARIPDGARRGELLALDAGRL